MISYNNYTYYRIHNDGERYFWISFNILILLSSLVGDSVILIASIKYNAIKLHRVIVTFIKHIAVADLVITITHVLPNIISTIADGWVFSDALFYAKVYIWWHAYPASMLFICAMVTGWVFIESDFSFN